MTKDFSCSFLGEQMVNRRSMTLGSAGFLAKSVGVIITSATVCVFCCSMFMGWMIQSGLDDLSYKKNSKLELIQMKRQLESQRNELLAQSNITKVAEGMGLYPASDSQVRPF